MCRIQRAHTGVPMLPQRGRRCARTGPTRLFDVLTLERADPDDAAHIFADALRLTTPGVSGDYRGAPVARDISYDIDSTPLDDLRGMSVPVFVAGGTADTHASIDSADLFVLELLRRPDRVLRYERLIGVDHAFMDANDTDYGARVFGDFLRWCRETPRGRAVETVPSVPSEPAHAPRTTP